MSTPYLLAKFKPTGEHSYAEEKEWKNKVIGIEPAPMMMTEKIWIYCLSPFWKFEQFKKDSPTPPFGFVYEDDINIITKFKK